MTAPTLSTLLDRIKQAGGQLPDDLLGEVICAVHGATFLEADISCGDGGSDEFTVWAGEEAVRGAVLYREDRYCCPDVSIDAAVALVQARLPHFTIDITIYRENGGEFKPSTSVRLFNPYGEIREYTARAVTPALALLAALLSALIAEGVG